MKAGHYSTSQGPLIHDPRLDGDEIAIRCSPVISTYLTGPAIRARWKHGRGLSAARFPIEPFQGAYCRLTLIDGAGRRAWSNPLWLDG